MKRIRLAVNGDDFGDSEEVNEAVVRAFKEGILTSCSLMAAGDAFDQAVRLAGENPELAVGVHLVAVCGRSVLPPGEIPHLVDREGRFSSDPAAAGLKYYFCSAARRELKRELTAQFEKCVSAGIRPSHVDGHLHLHIHPVIFEIATALGVEYGCKRMRVPEDDLSLALPFLDKGKMGAYLMERIFRLLTARMKKRLSREGFSYPDRVYGHFLSGRMSEEYVLSLLERMGSGKNELYFHPSTGTGGRAEFDILLSKTVRSRLTGLGIELTNYRGFETRS